MKSEYVTKHSDTKNSLLTGELQIILFCTLRFLKNETLHLRRCSQEWWLVHAYDFSTCGEGGGDKSSMPDLSISKITKKKKL